MHLRPANTLLLCTVVAAGCLKLPPPLPDGSPSSTDSGQDSDSPSTDSGPHTDTPDAAARDCPEPRQPADEGWIYVAAGHSHACALRADGKLYCWGDNRRRQFAPGAAEDLLPPDRIGVDEYEMVTAGENHVCAIDRDDRLWCWGNNDDGQVLPDEEPGEVIGVTEVLADRTILSPEQARVLDADLTHTCVLTGSREDASAFCWGRESAGLGESPGEPIPLGDVGPNPLLDVGDRVSCIYQNGMDPPINCWGTGNDLMQWAGCEDPCPRPQDPFSMIETPNARSASSFSVADNHACFVRDDGSDHVWCWGDNSDDRVWPGQPHPSRPYDTGVAAHDVAAGADHTCAVSCDGDVLCWGDGTYSQTGSVDDGLGQVSVDGESFIQVSAGAYFTCGVTDVGALYCWGRNAELQLGNPGSDSELPRKVTLQ